jgi:hypothetical protein
MFIKPPSGVQPPLFSIGTYVEKKLPPKGIMRMYVSPSKIKTFSLLDIK